MFMDTHPNLIYKSGDRENAVKWREKSEEDEKQDGMPGWTG